MKTNFTIKFRNVHLNGTISYSDEYDEYPEIRYYHPITMQPTEYAVNCLTGWSEQESSLNEEWKTLIDLHNQDLTFLEYCLEEEIEKDYTDEEILLLREVGDDIDEIMFFASWEDARDEGRRYLIEHEKKENWKQYIIVHASDPQRINAERLFS